ncbi:hypothetical protein GCM10022234_18920 [Aeromicrobium panaciterrae]|uniref:alpha/beta fold hydrolase n=1 Tax=Aeromicrobium panaciterrae TaxID=363861 RepID=UPI0031E2B9EA
MKTPLDVEVLGSGPALMMVHGAGGSPRDNFPFLDELASTFTVIAPSLPGVGGSPVGDEPLDAVAIADQLAAVLDDLGIATAAVCGYSMGTTIATHLAAAHPDRVSAFALCAGFATPRPSMLSLLELWDGLLADGTEEQNGRFILSTAFMPETIDKRGPRWVGLAAQAFGESLPAGTRAHLDLIRRVDSADALRSTTQPLLVVVPEHDGLVHPGHSADLLEIRPDAIRVGIEASHALWHEAPKEWLAALTDFFV